MIDGRNAMDIEKINCMQKMLVRTIPVHLFFRAGSLVFLFYTISLIIFWSLAMAKSDSKKELLFDSVEVLAKAKSQAENRVKLVRSLFEEEEIEKKDMREIKIRYEEARGNVNSSLERILVEIETNGSKVSFDSYEKIAKRAADQTADFIKASDKLILGEDRSALEASLQLGGSIVGAFVEIWKTVRGERMERDERLVRRFESLKWESFDQIK